MQAIEPAVTLDLLLGRGVVEFKEGLAGTGKEEGIEEKKDA